MTRYRNWRPGRIVVLVLTVQSRIRGMEGSWSIVERPLAVQADSIVRYMIRACWQTIALQHLLIAVIRNIVPRLFCGQFLGQCHCGCRTINRAAKYESSAHQKGSPSLSKSQECWSPGERDTWQNRGTASVDRKTAPIIDTGVHDAAYGASALLECPA